MAYMPGGWRRLTARKKCASFPDVKRAKVALCQPCLDRSKLEILGWSLWVHLPSDDFPCSSFLCKSPNLLPCRPARRSVWCHALFFLTLCFDSSCSPGLQSFFITPSIFLNDLLMLQDSAEMSACSLQNSLKRLWNFSTPDRVKNILFLWLQYL